MNSIKEKCLGIALRSMIPVSCFNHLFCNIIVKQHYTYLIQN